MRIWKLHLPNVHEMHKERQVFLRVPPGSRPLYVGRDLEGIANFKGYIHHVGNFTNLGEVIDMGEPSIWIEAEDVMCARFKEDPEKNSSKMVLFAVKTGENFPNLGPRWRHIGSIQWAKEYIILHFYGQRSES